MSKSVATPTQDDRRAKSGLRALVDEMMAQIRALSHEDRWTPESRAQAEADLERIMARVRREAVEGRQAQAS